MNQIKIGGYFRLPMRKAEKLFKQGKIIRVCGCKLSPVNGFGMFADISNSSTDCAFKDIVNAYKYYNCNHEVGYYPAFYVKEN